MMNSPMDRRSPYYKQVALLIRCLSYVAQEPCFALKGGTAINLFVNDFPRLSVDIDLAYLPLEPRTEALPCIRDALARITKNLNDTESQNAVLRKNKSDEMRIIVQTVGRPQDSAQIKIEVSPVVRGTLHEVAICDVVESVEQEFGFASVQTVSLPDLYGGKLCAAMDRQHPRDLFDVKVLLQSRGIDRDIFIGYIAYLLSHHRPISEVMNPRWKDIGEIFSKEFNGMALEPVTLEELQAIPDLMLQSLQSQFTQFDLDFLYSFKSGDPDWSLAPHQQIRNLPAVQWKLLNIQKMPEVKRRSALETLHETMLSWIER